MDVLRQDDYQFVNLSLGPDLPIEDDEVHVWTASLDEHFSDGRTLVTVAAGNTGENDWDAGNAEFKLPRMGSIFCRFAQPIARMKNGAVLRTVPSVLDEVQGW